MLFTGNRYIVVAVTLLITYIALTSQIFVFIPWLRTISLARTLQILVPFNIGVALIYWNYYLACTSDPGTPPAGWGVTEDIEIHEVSDDAKDKKNPSATTKADNNVSGAKAMDPGVGHSTAIDHSNNANLKQKKNHHSSSNNVASVVDSSTKAKNKEKEKNKTPLPRYCKTCEAFKPPRSHHCRICNKCILKMDHHCPWINNCVGYFNYGHFIRFITWVTLTTGVCLVLLVWRIVDVMQHEVYYMFAGTVPTKTQVIFMAVNIAVDGGVLLAVGILTIYHFWSMATNTSTIEVWEQEKVDAMIKKGKIRKVKFPYDVGCLRNYRQVLGPTIWLWLCPQRMLSSGTEFPVCDDKDAALIWPPREYNTSKKQNRTFVSEYSSSALRQRQHRNNIQEPLELPADGIDSKGQQHKRKDDHQVSGTAARAPPPSRFPTHVRRGSEGWVVQDLTVQQRAELYDEQVKYQRDHGDQEGNESDNEDYQEGLSDIEADSYGGLPGGMQSSRDYRNVEEKEEESSEEDDIPYDVASDEYDDDYEDEEDLDEYNPYLVYEEEDDEAEGGEAEDDEVTLHGQDRHKIGRFFDHLDPSSGAGHDYNGDNSDEWDEGEGLDVGCRPPIRMKGTHDEPSFTVQHDPKRKTFYTMLVEREEELKKQKAVATNKK
ncbi:Palmitoyltransferase [Modicella reniformis]|uniref:Palmitoyltransferase n=1 Tax=Modicella reniformis TaxID=1440133 RepID=A0A9P6MKC6_9FUNG|nr:Palmitoyltransferase [Modicella reniformis]